MRWWLPPAILGGLVVLVIVVGVVLLATQDVSELKGVITERVSEETGRELAIHGEFDLEISFSPAIVAENVTFENASWGSRPEMLTIKRLEAEVGLFDMIGGRTEIKRLVLIDADILVETNEAGEGNWKFEKAPDKAGEAQTTKSDDEGGGLPAIHEATIENAVITYRDGKTGEERRVAIDRVDGRSEGDDGPLHFDLKGRIDETPVTAEATVGQGRRNVPVKIDAALAGATLGIEGAIGDAEEMTGIDLAMNVSGDSLSDLTALGMSGLPDAGPYSVSARLADQDKSYVVRDLVAKIAESDLSGAVTMTPGDQPRIKGKLASKRLDLDALMPTSDDAATGSVGSGGGDGSGGGSAEGSADGGQKRIFSDEPLSLDGLDQADVSMELVAAEVLYRGMTLSGVTLNMIVQDGKLRIDPLQAGLAGGTLGASLALDSTVDPPALDVTMDLAKVDLQTLQALTGMEEVVSGPLDMTVALQGRGNSPRAIAASLDGRVDLIVGSGKIHNEYVDLIAADLFGYLIPGIGGGDAAQLNCFVTRFAVNDGLATSEALLFDTALTTTAGEGTVNLATEMADLTVVPRPKDESLLSLAVPIVVDGPLTDLGYTLKKEEALLGAAGAVLGTAILGPFGILIPFVSTGTSDENPCVAALNQKPGEGQAGVQKSAPERIVEGLGDAGEGLGNAADGVGDAAGEVGDAIGDAAGDVGDAVGDALDDVLDIFD